MPPRRRGRSRINLQDRDRQEDEPIRESVEAQASVDGSPSIAAPSATPVVDPNLAEAVAALAKAIPTLSAPAERRNVHLPPAPAPIVPRAPAGRRRRVRCDPRR